MNDIIRGTKEQNIVSLTHQQTVLEEQMSGLHEAITQIKDSIWSRQEQAETEINDQKQKMTDLEQATLKHATTVSETLESEIGRFERVISAFEKYVDQQTSDLRDQVVKIDEAYQNFKIENEDINEKKVAEIH